MDKNDGQPLLGNSLLVKLDSNSEGNVPKIARSFAYQKYSAPSRVIGIPSGK